MGFKNYIDLFAGCGGLSLGLHHAGWHGLFAIEKDSMAFETLEKNLCTSGSPYPHFTHWPEWLPKTNHNISDLLDNTSIVRKLKSLRGKVSLVVGGPPCQGFSLGGARQVHDERNQLVYKHLDFVSLVLPDYVIIENVEGIARAFKSDSDIAAKSVLYMILKKLDKMEYNAGYFIARALDAGVPQDRRRVIIIGVKKKINSVVNPGIALEQFYKFSGLKLREKYKLPIDRPITIGEALDDLAGDDFVDCPDSPKFQSARYLKANSKYQELMRKGIKSGSIPNSHRFSKHGHKVLSLYENCLEKLEPGRVSRKFLLENKTKTQKKFLLGRDIHASTVTTHPDEHIHFKYPRNISLREMARLQSFPDDFFFYGRYTLNGERRKLDVSRCAQIGNAVPPFLGEALGNALNEFVKVLQSKSPYNDILDSINSNKRDGENLDLLLC
jgi:DNA (cytosine-5)-methyltransferase 1